MDTTPNGVRTITLDRPERLNAVNPALAASLPAAINCDFDIGGPDVLTYLDMMRRYAVVAYLPRRLILPVPVLTPWLSAQWVNLVTPVPRSIATG